MRKLIVLVIAALCLTGCMDPVETAKRSADGVSRTASTTNQQQSRQQAAEIMLTIEGPEAPEGPDQPQATNQPIRVLYSGGEASAPAGSRVTLRAGSSSSDSQNQSQTVTTADVWRAVRAVPPGVLYAGIGLIVIGLVLAVAVRGLRLAGLAISGGGIVGMGAVILLYQFGQTIAYCIGGAVIFLALVAGLVIWYAVRQKMLFQTAFSQTVSGIQKFMESSDPATVAQVKAQLGRKQDSNIQALVKKEKL